MPHTLFHLPYSPWSEKARWALAHAGVRYRAVVHLPMLGEPRLRLAARRLTGRCSVPLLVAESGERIDDSFAIARFADERRQPSTASLFQDHEELASTYNALSERMLDAGRRLVTERIAHDPEALDAEVPSFIPGPMRAMSARMGMGFFQRKWGLDAESAEQRQREASDELRRGLLALREALAGKDASGSPALLGSAFSYADIAMACALQPVLPVADRFVPLPPARRKVWTQDELADEFSDLVAWRDRVYESHR